MRTGAYTFLRLSLQAAGRLAAALWARRLGPAGRLCRSARATNTAVRKQWLLEASPNGFCISRASTRAFQTIMLRACRAAKHRGAVAGSEFEG